MKAKFRLHNNREMAIAISAETDFEQSFLDHFYGKITLVQECCSARNALLLLGENAVSKEADNGQ